MPLFWKPYKSDTTTFIEALKAAKPTLEANSGPAAPCCGTARSTARRRPSGATPRGPAALRLPDQAVLSDRVGPQTLADELATAAPPQPDVVDQVAVARLYGEPLFRLPQDLYIPPDALEVFSRPSKARWTCCCT
jgi:hypothetical protein